MSGQGAFDEAPGGLADAVQRFGLLSAAAVVDRYVAVVDRVVSTGVRAVGGTPAPPPGAEEVVEAAMRAVGAVLGVLGSTRDVPSGRTSSAVLLSDVAPGGRSVGRLWVHGPGDRRTRVALHPTGLVSARGSVLDAARVTLDPREVEVAPGGSAEVVVGVEVPADAPAGTYHGVLVASADRADPLRLVLPVRPARAHDGT